MVIITNGRHNITVTRGAYNGVWKSLGYRMVGGEKGAEKDTAPKPYHEPDKPIAQWSNIELKMYAEYYGVDLKGTKNASQARERIKAFKDAQNAQEVQ